MKRRLFLLLVLILFTNHCANADLTSLESLEEALPAIVVPPFHCLDDKNCQFQTSDLPTLHEHLTTKHPETPTKCCEKCDSFYIFSSMHEKECLISSHISPNRRKTYFGIYYRTALRMHLHEAAKKKLTPGEEFVKVLQQTTVSVPPLS